MAGVIKKRVTSASAVVYVAPSARIAMGGVVVGQWGIIAAMRDSASPKRAAPPSSNREKPPPCHSSCICSCTPGGNQRVALPPKRISSSPY